MRNERGSALLIVFMFAAIIAIMLYMEMPVAAFEAQRQKEQLLIDRGNEYAHAVKLFVRKTGMYPTSIDQLENTNRMRFLRHRFKDPLTGKDDWRLLHAGPGGMLLDSKVNPINANTQTGSGSSGPSNSIFGSNSSSSFGSNRDTSGDQVQVAQVPQRPPAIAANGGAAGDTSAAGADPTSISPLLAPGQAAQVSNAQPSAPAQASAPTQPGGQPPPQSQSAVQNNPAGVQPGDPNFTPMLRNLLTNPNAPLPQTAASGPFSNSPQMGRIASGGIAGVASIAKGHSIKTVKDQTDYSLWEFYYDPTKDVAAGMPGAIPAAAAPAANSGAAGGNSFTLNSPFTTQPAPNTTAPPPPPSNPPASLPPPNPPPELK